MDFDPLVLRMMAHKLFWGRKPLVIPGVMTLATLADVALIEKRLPAQLSGTCTLWRCGGRAVRKRRACLPGRRQRLA
jgi:hypothetical protein